jgi:hypothetical protein
LAAPGTLLADPTLPFPATLSEVGLYPEAPRLDRVPLQAVAYTPRWELWSNGLDKERFVRIPDGAQVGTVNPDDWDFPVGTLFFKTFGVGEGPIETRILRVTADGLDYAVYGWNEAATEAWLLDMKEPASVPVVLEGGDEFDHEVPSKLQCRKCHESAPEWVLGFSALQLVDEQNEEPRQQIAALRDAGLLDGPGAESISQIAHDDPLTAQVLGYFHGNCVHCHNGSDGPSSSFDLGWQVALENTLGKPTEGIASAVGLRVVPGDPDASIVYQALLDDSGNEARTMPPVGVQRRDTESIEMIRTWIEVLPSKLE